MSTLKVEVIKVDNVLPHSNADRLEIAVVKGWNCVVQKGEWHSGDLGIYFPIDSMLHPTVEAFLFPPESKVKLTNSRIRTIKLRGAISQGLLVSISDAKRLWSIVPVEGADLTAVTGTKKYEPHDNMASQNHTDNRKRTKSPNPFFHKYTDIENFKNHITLFKPGEAIVVQEKIHGTNFRAGWVLYHADTWWKKVLAFIGLAPMWEFVYGSHNVQLQNRFLPATYYDKNIYAEVVHRYDLKNRIPRNMVIYGEIYGVDVQKGYNYGLDKTGAHRRSLVVFDVKVGAYKYMDYTLMRAAIASMDLARPPEFYVGAYVSQEHLKSMVDGPSALNFHGSQKYREGVVVRAYTEQVCYLGRKILKYKSDEFLALFEDDTH